MKLIKKITIIPATIHDIARVQEIYAYHVLNGLGTFEEIPPTIEEMSQRYTKIISKGFPFLLAIIDGEVVGYAYASYFRERTAYRFTVEDSIYLDPKYCKCGIGSTLMSELIKQCRSLGYSQMLAVIGDSNNFSSINLHKKFGFELNGILKNVGYKFEKDVDVVIMQLNLNQE